MSTPHNDARPEDIAKTVLMPGDPLRARYIAENYLDEPVQFNTIRNMLGYTGNYKGRRISVMGSGMGMPSMGIYSYELYSFYNVERIIRIGSAGGYSDDVRLRDVIIAMGTSTDSNYASQYKLPGTIAPLADYEMLCCAVNAAKARNINYKVGNVLSSDVFYHTDDNESARQWRSMGVLAVEMECAALYMNAAALGRKALGIFTISDHLFTGESLDAMQRQTSFADMMQIALDIA